MNQRDLRISVITNFGCKNKCEYCIWKNHPLKNVHKKTDFEKLNKYLDKTTENKIISISGGGDPLENFNNNKIFWNCVFKLKNDKTQIDLHTSYYNENTPKKFLMQFRKVVLHIEFLQIYYNLNKISEFFKKTNLARLCFVVHKGLTIPYMNALEEWCQKSNVELSYRELFKNNDFSPYKEDFNYAQKINDRLKIGKFIKQDDYSIYFMPDNNFYEDYFCKRKMP